VDLLRLQLYPLESDPHRFKAIATDARGNSAHHEPSLPFLDGEQDRRYTVVKMLEATCFRAQDFPDAGERGWMVRQQLLHPDQDAFQPDWLKTVGRALYGCLGRKIHDILQAALAEARGQGAALHIRLEFPHDAPELARLTDYPWEVMADELGHLAHWGAAFSRYIAYRSPRPKLSPTERLNVLLVSSRATDPHLGLEALPDAEVEAMRAGLDQTVAAGKIHLEGLPAATRSALRTRLIQSQPSTAPHVLHFDGHGYFGRRCNQDGCGTMHKPKGGDRCHTCHSPLPEPAGYLLFEHERGGADYVSASELGELLGNLARGDEPGSRPGIVLAVLSGCKTGLSLLSRSVFNGVAQNLIGQGIPAVVAMQYSVSVAAASGFTKVFYQSLGQMESLAIALKRGQSAMGISGQQWYRPVLYLRWPDDNGGELFDLKHNPDDSMGLAMQESSPEMVPSTAQAASSSPRRISQLSVPTKLSVEEFDQLCDALISAFLDWESLNLMVKRALGMRLNQIDQGATTYEITVNRLVEFAESNGQLEKLIVGAMKRNSGNPKLNNLVRNWSQ